MVSYFSLVVLAVAAVFFSLFSFFVYLFTPPRDFPKNIPTIPFYYALLPLFKDGDQLELYHQYLKEPLETYGAVKIFFGGRWNILVRKPSYIAQVFKHEDTFAKSGNQVKIPHSLLAEYTGDNIISGHGKDWKLYTSVIKPALQADHDSTLLWKNSTILKDMFIQDSNKANGNGTAIYAPLHRHALANLSEVLYGSDFETLTKPDAPLHSLQTKIKPNIFNPVFLNFPFLDHLSLKSRQFGRDLVRKFRNTLRNQVARGHNHACDPSSTNLGCRLLGAHREGILNTKQLHDNLVSTFLAGHENPQLALMSLMYLLGANPTIQAQLRTEINTLFTETDTPSYAALHDLPLLTSTIYESLRLFPPISQLINRCTSEPTRLGNDIVIPAGTYMGYNAYSTNRDVEFWGPDADSFRPERWGTTMDDINALFRRANAKGAFISFHGGRRACLGHKFAMQSLRVTLAELLRGVRWDVHGSWDGRMTPAGPLYPRGLKLGIEVVEKGA